MEFIKYVIWGIVIFLLIIVVIWIFSLFGVITVNAESAVLDHIRVISELIPYPTRHGIGLLWA